MQVTGSLYMEPIGEDSGPGRGRMVDREVCDRPQGRRAELKLIPASLRIALWLEL